MKAHIRLLFVEASGSAFYGKQEKTARALLAWFKDQDDSIIYLKSRHISEKIGGVMSPKEIGKGMEWLRENDNEHSIDVSKRGYNSGTVWQVKT